MDDILEWEGKRYTRRSGKWVGSDHTVVPEILQDKLNRAYYETIDLSKLTADEAIREGDKFKSSASYGLAIKLYVYSMERASYKDAVYILPRLTSCYRAQGRAQDVIKMASMVKKRYGGEIFSPVLLTSIAAAYCDLGEYGQARKCCDKAYAMAGGHASGELSLVYKRIEPAQKPKK